MILIRRYDSSNDYDYLNSIACDKNNHICLQAEPV